MMRKMTIGLLLCLLLAGCGLKVERPADELVREISMPVGECFTPGDEVTVRAVGFAAGDEIWFEVFWSEGSEEFAPNGSAKGIRGTVTGCTDTSISFLVPGHYPPATVTVQLFRGGIFQPLGTIRTNDGVQHETFLYTASSTPAGGTAVTRYPIYGSASTGKAVLTSDRWIESVAGSFGPGTACGVADGRLVELDLITRQEQESGDGCLLTGSVSESTVVGLYARSDRLYLSGGSLPYSWQLPEGVTVDRIVRQPFAFAFNALLLAVRNDDGTHSPLVLPLSGTRALLGPAVESEILLPYWMMKPAADDPSQRERVGGYAALHGDLTWFQPLDPATLTLAPTLAEADFTVQGRVVSMTQCMLLDEEGAEARVGVVCETGNGRRAWICNSANGSKVGVLGDVNLHVVREIFFAR